MGALSAPVRAVLLMLLANVCVAAMTCTIRIAAAELHPFEIAFLRNLFGLAFLLPFLIRAGAAAAATAPEPLTVPPARPG